MTEPPLPIKFPEKVVAALPPTLSATPAIETVPDEPCRPATVPLVGPAKLTTAPVASNVLFCSAAALVIVSEPPLALVIPV